MVASGLTPIRAIGRGLQVLRAISREQSASMTQIADATALPYPTVCRVVRTLIGEGYVEQEPDQKRFRVTGLVQSLAHGYQDHSRLTEAARGHLVMLTEKTHWPFIIATRTGTGMIVRDSTHSLTSMTLNHYYPGYVFPILDSGSGLAYLAFADDKERESILEAISLEGSGATNHALVLARSGTQLEQIKAAGYAIRERNMFAMPPGKNSSLAVPIFKDGTVHGALAMVFFGAAMSRKVATAEYAATIGVAAAKISQKISKQSELSRSIF